MGFSHASQGLRRGIRMYNFGAHTTASEKCPIFGIGQLVRVRSTGVETRVRTSKSGVYTLEEFPNDQTFFATDLEAI